LRLSSHSNNNHNRNQNAEAVVRIGEKGFLKEKKRKKVLIKMRKKA